MQGMKSSLASREVIADSVELTSARPLLRCGWWPWLAVINLLPGVMMVNGCG
jgi:hypothetical protein